jgi:hypothetical protein
MRAALPETTFTPKLREGMLDCDVAGELALAGPCPVGARERFVASANDASECSAEE